MHENARSTSCRNAEHVHDRGDHDVVLRVEMGVRRPTERVATSVSSSRWEPESEQVGDELSNLSERGGPDVHIRRAHSAVCHSPHDVGDPL